jgi:hypothetical protein
MQTCGESAVVDHGKGKTTVQGTGRVENYYLRKEQRAVRHDYWYKRHVCMSSASCGNVIFSDCSGTLGHDQAEKA